MIGKKIVVLSSHTPSLFWFRMDMMREFARRGCRVYALGNEEEAQWRDRFSESGICYRQIPVRRNGLNPLQDFRTFSAIRRELREIRPDGIFCFQAKTVIYGSLAAKSLGIREIYPPDCGAGFGISRRGSEIPPCSRCDDAALPRLPACLPGGIF